MKTVITHIFNEEYLLPWWLEHHRKIFDFGVVIDYNSTDRSLEIVREMCPHWQILPSQNQYFDARKCDNEVEFCERQIQGWRIALTTTEFLVGDVDKLAVDTPARMQWFIPGIRFTGWDLNREFDRSKPLWGQHVMGIPWESNSIAHQCRSLHNFNDIKYTPGRHFMPHNTTNPLIFHYAHTIVGLPMLDRRLQVQYKVSPEDRAEGLGTHHYGDGHLTIAKLHQMHHEWLNVGERDCSQYIDSVTK